MSRLSSLFLAGVALIALSSAASAASFSCYGNLTYTERAICDNPNLSNLDSVMASTYFQMLGGSSKTLKRALQRDQIGWLRSRNSCGANVGCLSAAYHNRLSQFDTYGD